MYLSSLLSARRTWQINLPCPESTRASGWLFMVPLLGPNKSNKVYKKKKKNEGGRFQVFDLNTRIWKEEEFPGRKVKQFKQVNEAKPGHHNVPLSQTFQSVDALVPPDILYQMTVSPSHGIKERGLDTLNFTGTYPINFYFVTLIEGFESFKKANWGMNGMHELSRW
ncbi:hypothetical protein BGX38DRAFT_906002 [Terfezia claveryi]|nr:hypothetical protein BGX38DRAFT_906002 [Terfezia claveryi]